MPPESWYGYFLEHIQRIVDVHHLQSLNDASPALLFRKSRCRRPECFKKLRPHGVKRIERRHRLLDYHGDSLAAGCRARFPDLPAKGRCRPKRTLPETRKEGGASPNSARHVSDLPLPLSPTTPRHVPGSRQKCTSRTISAPVRESRTVKSRTSSKLMNVPCPRVWDQRRHAGCRLKN